LDFLHIVSKEEDAYERGYNIGTQGKALVKANLQAYMRRFQHFGLGRQTVLRMAAKFRPTIEKYDEEMLQEMRSRSIHRSRV
jgi:hypothetical protein